MYSLEQSEQYFFLSDTVESLIWQQYFPHISGSSLL